MKASDIQLTKRHYGIISLILLAALVITVFFAYNTYAEKKQYQTFLSNGYQRAFREMVTNVENIKVLLDKAEVTASSKNSNFLMTQVWQQASSASSNLGQLPITHIALSNTSKFLNQVGDFCYTISQQNAANKVMDNEQHTKISKLNGYSTSLLKDLRELQANVEEGKIRFGELKKKGKLVLQKAPASAIDTSFSKVDEKFTEYPTMIYDGPFSDNVVEGKPKGLTGDTIKLDAAKAAAKKFIGHTEIAKVNLISSGRGIIETYGLELIPKADKEAAVNLDITKKGGHVLWMLNPRDIPDKKLTEKQGIDKAKEFLKNHGFGNLVETYYLQNDNNMVITFIGEKDGILLYPDLLKVKVALDNGEIVGFDAYQFLMAGKVRENLKAKITEDEARKKVTQQLNVERVKLAVIPMPGNKEQLCYEFKGKYKNDDYFVYINADTGEEEKILKIIKSENGTLTQ